MTETIAYSGPRITPEQVAEGVLRTGIEPVPDMFHNNSRRGHRCACGLGIIVAARFGVPTLNRVGNKADKAENSRVVFDKLGLDEFYGSAFIDGFDSPVGDSPSPYRNNVMHAGWADGVVSRIAAEAAWDQMQAAKPPTKGTP